MWSLGRILPAQRGNVSMEFRLVPGGKGIRRLGIGLNIKRPVVHREFGLQSLKCWIILHLLPELFHINICPSKVERVRSVLRKDCGHGLYF